MSRPQTEEQRRKRNSYMAAYLRQYRKEHPDRVRQWRENYYRNALARLQRDDSGADCDQCEGGERA